MNIPVEFFIIASSLLGALISALAVRLYYRQRIDRIEKDSWRSAKTYYEHRRNPSERRI